MGGDSFSSEDGRVKEIEQREDDGDMHKQYSMDMVVPDSTADRSQDIGLQKFMGVNEEKGDFSFVGLETGDVERVSDTRDEGFGVNEGERFSVSPAVVGDRLDMGCMRREVLRVLEVLSEVPSWSSDETVAVMNRVDDDIQIGLDIAKLERQPGNVTTSEQVVEGTGTDGVLSRRALDSQLIPLNGKMRKKEVVVACNPG
ncbi:hypothetical protein V6N12_048138 [Hibiscus sabdariffa]|uniref:Uncharacterized protein n=1 Tax=Hibiscus sabdariffa TaxID=183260 RepID=A0ABR2EIQ3_9ROSI